jgi:hypothetical protein
MSSLSFNDKGDSVTIHLNLWLIFSSPELAQGELLGSLNVFRPSTLVR